MTTRVTVDIERSTEPSSEPTIAGTVILDGSNVAFVGWVALLQILQQAVDGQPDEGRVPGAGE